VAGAGRCCKLLLVHVLLNVDAIKVHAIVNRALIGVGMFA
jgi:hypothetical protein